MGRRNPKPKLTPSWLPWVREHIADHIQEKLDMDNAGGDATYRAMLQRLWSQADSLRMAPLWWVSHDMTMLAVHTALHEDPPDLDEPPSPTGLVVFDGGLPIEAPEGYADREQVSVTGMYWEIDYHDGDYYRTGIQLFTSSPEVLRRDAPHLPMWLIELPEPIEHMPDVWSSLLKAVWALSAEPTVCDTRQPSQASVTLDRLPARYEPEARRVKMLVLRENLHRPGGVPDGERHRASPDHRYIVRGFWRNQPYGEGHALRRRQWIPPYVKGPADKPLVCRETVRIWRR